VNELQPGEMKLLEWEDLEIGVFNCAGTVYAIEDRCSHDNGTLVAEDRATDDLARLCSGGDVSGDH